MLYSTVFWILPPATLSSTLFHLAETLTHNPICDSVSETVLCLSNKMLLRTNGQFNRQCLSVTVVQSPSLDAPPASNFRHCSHRPASAVRASQGWDCLVPAQYYDTFQPRQQCLRRCGYGSLRSQTGRTKIPASPHLPGMPLSCAKCRLILCACNAHRLSHPAR